MPATRSKPVRDAEAPTWECEVDPALWPAWTDLVPYTVDQPRVARDDPAEIASRAAAIRAENERRWNAGEAPKNQTGHRGKEVSRARRP